MTEIHSERAAGLSRVSGGGLGGGGDDGHEHGNIGDFILFTVDSGPRVYGSVAILAETTLPGGLQALKSQVPAAFFGFVVSKVKGITGRIKVSAP